MADVVAVKIVEDIKNIPSRVPRTLILRFNRYSYCRCTECNKIYPTYIIGERLIKAGEWDKFCPFCKADLNNPLIYRPIHETEVISIRYDEESEQWNAYDEFDNVVKLFV